MRECVAWVVRRICEHHAETIAAEATIQGVAQVIVRGLLDKPKISNFYCLALNDFAASLEITEENVNQNALSAFYKEILEALFNNASREDAKEDGVNLQESSYVAFAGLV